MRHTATSSRLRATLLHDLAPLRPLIHSQPPCLLRTHNALPPHSRPFHLTPRRHASAPRAPTHYDLFPLTLPNGPPPASPFAIPLRDLRAEFLQLQARAHPDRHPSSDKARAEGASARINAAYKTLQSPLERALYLLRLRGVNLEEEMAGVDDTGLLMEVLEAREGIEEAREEAELEELRMENEERVEECERGLGEAFARDDLEGARMQAVRLKFWISIRETLREWHEG